MALKYYLSHDLALACKYVSKCWPFVPLLWSDSIKVLSLCLQSDEMKSNRRPKATKIPGITRSPSPRMVYSFTNIEYFFGKISFIGSSRFEETVVIMSVPKTKITS